MASNINDLKKNKNKYSIDEYKQKLSELKIQELKELARKEKITGFSKYKIKVCLQDFILAKVKKIPLSKECWDKYGGTDDLKPKSKSSKPKPKPKPKPNPKPNPKPKSKAKPKPKPKPKSKAKPSKASKVPKDCNPQYMENLSDFGITKLKKEECPKFFGAKNASKETINKYLGQSCSSLKGNDKQKLINAIIQYCGDQEIDDDDVSYQSPPTPGVADAVLTPSPQSNVYKQFIPSANEYNDEVKQLFDYYKTDQPSVLYSDLKKKATPEVTKQYVIPKSAEKISPIPSPIFGKSCDYIYIRTRNDKEEFYKIDREINVIITLFIMDNDGEYSIKQTVPYIHQDILSDSNYDKISVYLSNNSAITPDILIDNISALKSQNIVTEVPNDLEELHEILDPYIQSPIPLPIPLSLMPSPPSPSLSPPPSPLNNIRPFIELDESGNGKNTYLLFVDDGEDNNYRILNTDDEIEAHNIPYDINGYQKIGKTNWIEITPETLFLVFLVNDFNSTGKYLLIDYISYTSLYNLTNFSKLYFAPVSLIQYIREDESGSEPDSSDSSDEDSGSDEDEDDTNMFNELLASSPVLKTPSPVLKTPSPVLKTPSPADSDYSLSPDIVFDTKDAFEKHIKDHANIDKDYDEYLGPFDKVIDMFRVDIEEEDPNIDEDDLEKEVLIKWFSDSGLREDVSAAAPEVHEDAKKRIQKYPDLLKKYKKQINAPSITEDDINKMFSLKFNII